MLNEQLTSGLLHFISPPPTMFRKGQGPANGFSTTDTFGFAANPAFGPRGGSANAPTPGKEVLQPRKSSVFLDEASGKFTAMRPANFVAETSLGSHGAQTLGR